jgi:hypothetical protein
MLDDHGVRRKAAWNRLAYRYTTTPDQSEQHCQLAATWDAISLIRRSSRYVDAELQRAVYDSVKEAMHYVLERLVFDDGTYRQTDIDEHPTAPHYMEHIMEDSSWLERRVVTDLPPPQVSARRGAGDACTFLWRDPAGEMSSLRVYIAPRGTVPVRLNETHLAGVLQRRGQRPADMDPFLAVQAIRRATAARWGGSTDLPPPDDWRGKKYLPWKLRQVTFPLPHSEDLQPLTLLIERLDQHEIYVSAATWYGEESRPLPLLPE